MMKILIAMISIASICFASPSHADNYFMQIWEDALPKLEKALDVFDKQDNLPESSFFGADKSSNMEKYKELLDEVFEILLGSDFSTAREEYAELEEDIAKAESEIVSLRKQQITAPEETWIPLKSTRSKIDEKISSLKSEIAGYERGKTDIKSRMTEQLQAMGVNVESTQLDILLSSISGDDVLDLLTVADSIKKINMQIVELLEKGQGNAQMARRYTGVHMVLVSLYLHANETALARIDSDYIPALEAIMKEAQKLRKEAQDMLKRAGKDERQKKLLTINVNANERTVKTAELYRAHLRKQQSQLRQDVAKLKSDLLVAQNTYHTVKTGNELISLIQVSMGTLESVFGFVMPDMSAAFDQEMMREFERITEQIKKAK